MKTVRHGGRFMGRVQGVGFRVFVQNVAQELGFTGWVKNMADGSVVMEAQGDEARFGELRRRRNGFRDSTVTRAQKYPKSCIGFWGIYFVIVTRFRFPLRC